jgi:hypothetical protein
MQSLMNMTPLCILRAGSNTGLFEMTCMHAILWSYPIYNIYKLVDDHNRTPRE